jgi:hypothetical protein
MPTAIKRPATTTQLYERCAECRGLGESPPDIGIHECLHEHSAKLRPKRRKIPVLCPNCQGAGFIPADSTREDVRALAVGHAEAMRAMRDFVDACHDDAPDRPSYLSDGLLLGFCVRFQQLLDRD